MIHSLRVFSVQIKDCGVKDLMDMSCLRAAKIASLSTQMFLESNKEVFVLHRLLGSFVKLNKIWHSSSN